MEKITLIGRLGRDASVKESQQGTRFLTFTMACDAFVRGENRTHWYDITSFDPNRYKNMLKYLTKGSSVTVVGDLDADLDEGRDGVTRIRRRVSADSIQFTPGNSSGSTSESKTTTKRDSEPDDIDESEMTTTRSRSSKPEEYSDEERPSRKSKRVVEDDDDEPEVKPRRSKAKAEEEDDEPEVKPRRRSRSEDEEDEEPQPKAKRREKPAEEDDEDDLPF